MGKVVKGISLTLESETLDQLEKFRNEARMSLAGVVSGMVEWFAENGDFFIIDNRYPVPGRPSQQVVGRPYVTVNPQYEMHKNPAVPIPPSPYAVQAPVVATGKPNTPYRLCPGCQELVLDPAAKVCGCGMVLG